MRKHNYIARSTAFIIALLFIGTVNAQLRKSDRKVIEYDSSVVDETYGIIIYEKLNPYLEGDSTRMCGNYACNNWQEDKYIDGKILHKGFYVNGQLRTYKNYYPNGNLERDFRNIDDHRASLKLYHPNGSLKSEAKYIKGEAIEWRDYYENGQLEYEEVYGKKRTWHDSKKSYYPNGSPQYTQLVLDKKKLLFSRIEYHENGKVKLEGELRFDESLGDYVKTGKWAHYNESGSKIREETFKDNLLVNTVNL
ncbi:MAG: toxin-antitoxin system YwqK family antitoxin [Flavobacteriales bacterium]